MNPPGAPREDKASAGFVVGGILTIFVGAILSLLLGLGGMFGPSNVPCGQAYGEGGALLAVAVIFAALAWYAFFRNKSRNFGIGFLRGVAVAALIVVLVPWPCSYTMTTLGHVTSCTR